MSREHDNLAFAVTMLPREAEARAIIAKQVDGIHFEQKRTYVLPTGETFTAPPDHIIGITIAESDEALLEFNRKLKKLIPFKISSRG